ncbi:MAG TPA: AAA family ATPase [Ktedonobacterales bacterium]
MPDSLLEREGLLAQLDALLRGAAGGGGKVVLVSGEAGIGKTSLVERFAGQHQADSRTLWGACEALFTPRPLAPLYDIARASAGPLRALLERPPERAAIYAALLDELQAGTRPVIVVFEDVHWADEATLDVIKFLGRRIQPLRALFIVTFRDDEIGPAHPLRTVIGDLPARAVARLAIPPLSERAVHALAAPTGQQSARLYAVTGGNPFFVSEVLASGATGVPASVRDAVLARVGRLSPAARGVVELAAVVPARVEQELLDQLVGPSAPSVEEALSAGVLRADGAQVAFRHELARQAVEEALAPATRRALNRQVLRQLLESTAEPLPVARLVHHATQAQDAALVLRYAPPAAREAAARGAHREAAAHYATALRHGAALAPAERAGLFEALSYEDYLTSRMDESALAREQALAIWQELGDTRKVGHNVRRLSRLHWFLGHHAEADRLAKAAVRQLEGGPADSELAMAYSNRAQLAMLSDDLVSARLWGERAIALAERLGDQETLCHALNNVGAAELNACDERGRAKLERSLRLALEHGFEEHVARAYTNLAESAVMFRDYTRAVAFHDIGIVYCRDHDLDTWEAYMRSWQARQRLEQGEWDGAAADATAVVSAPHEPAANRIPALIVLGLLRARRGDPDSARLLDEARDLALATREPQRIAPMAAARAEVAWLAGDLAQCQQEERVGYDLARAHHNPWATGELAYWLWRGGDAVATDGIAEPYALWLAGAWAEAAAAWERIGCPYERALALLDGDEPAQREALALLERLGAAPLAELARQRLRARGARGIPRGPRPTTRANPAGLTGRQQEVLALLGAGLSNQEIADRLSTSPKTTEHHVSAILEKLGARSRAQAIAEAHRLGLLPDAPRGSPA